MKVVILQPSYIPWRGFFDQIQKADLFIFYDDVQYDKRGWRNRNKIKTPNGAQWITIPVHSHNAQIEKTPINQILIDWEQPWNEWHMKTLQVNYSKAAYYKNYANWLEDVFSRHSQYLADFTIPLTIEITQRLGFTQTQFLRSSDLCGINGQKTTRLIQILQQVGATHYISGPSAQNYIDAEQFKAAGISLKYVEYNYPEYPQLYLPFDPFVSILDLLFMTGSRAAEYICNPT